ncbi:MAG: bifunctional 2-polyprenyl-6-hydroxyphenol methylase/3-demethylubiquinol 3-O-methyltransferase UbiG [Alphaproteobacteria bacterium]|nr:bifunctional 2-polyprenyl-6-hydroxyphenol methylase/3-demethylubiquinol 3-O-methyltransferase UbiG [Alphaproteobacteria bacterium]
MPSSASIDKDEIAQFSAHAGDWWNPDGAMRPLHRLNPTRLEYIRDQVCRHFGRKMAARDSLAGLATLDIGCGGGILCEPLARMGATVTGLDASAEAIDAARVHAAQSGLGVTYISGSAEDFAQGKKKFDVITVLEILEHVADMDSLLNAVAALLKPNGIVILSTVNRNAKSFLLGIVAAEYLLKWVPRGTHDWRKFVKPSELAAHLGKAGLQVSDITGMRFDPLNATFHLRRNDASVNYLMSAVATK